MTFPPEPWNGGAMPWNLRTVSSTILFAYKVQLFITVTKETGVEPFKWELYVEENVTAMRVQRDEIVP